MLEFKSDEGSIGWSILDIFENVMIVLGIERCNMWKVFMLEEVMFDEGEEIY